MYCADFDALFSHSRFSYSSDIYSRSSGNREIQTKSERTVLKDVAVMERSVVNILLIDLGEKMVEAERDHFGSQTLEVTFSIQKGASRVMGHCISDDNFCRAGNVHLASCTGSVI
ncbi:hypothetical protein R1flu_010154 [Riccia fluitans]|uniref:Uncharacterized protein n=1 Tax=Riccia fluitans TaxID=41844 RepID=A0ABD1Z469_9MARC